MKLLLKLRQYCMILAAVPGRFRPRGIAITQKTSKVAEKTSSSRKNTLLPLLLGFQKHKLNLIHCFFPVYESEILTDRTVAKWETTFEMREKIKQLYHQRSRNLLKFFFRDFFTYLKQVMFNRMGFTFTRFGINDIC